MPSRSPSVPSGLISSATTPKRLRRGASASRPVSTSPSRKCRAILPRSPRAGGSIGRRCRVRHLTAGSGITARPSPATSSSKLSRSRSRSGASPSSISSSGNQTRTWLIKAGVPVQAVGCCREGPRRPLPRPHSPKSDAAGPAILHARRPRSRYGREPAAHRGGRVGRSSPDRFGGSGGFLRGLAAFMSRAVPVPELSQPDDLVLIRSYVEGDASAFDRIFARYHQRIRALCSKHVGDGQVAEDLVQETFYNVLRSLRRVDDTFNFSAWIHRIATNLCHDELRRRHKAQHHLEPGGVDVEDAVLRLVDRDRR